MAKVFRIEGSFRTGHHDQPFRKELVADSEERARELLASLLGSKHGVPRRLIRVTKVTPVPLDQVQNAVVRHQAGLP